MTLGLIAAFVLAQVEPVLDEVVLEAPAVEWHVFTGDHTFDEPMFCADEVEFMSKAEEVRQLRATKPISVGYLVIAGLLGLAAGIAATYVVTGGSK